MASYEWASRDPAAQNPSRLTNSGKGTQNFDEITSTVDVDLRSDWSIVVSPRFSGLWQDFIFNCGGLSIAFVFLTNWDSNNVSTFFNRVKKLNGQFAHLYIVVTLPTEEEDDSFILSYFKNGMELGRPPFVLVHDVEMGFEKIVKIAHSRGMCKRQDAISKLKSERKRSVEEMDNFLKVVTSIPGIDNHDAHALNQAIGSIEAIAKASKESILENTDLSAEKADMIIRFFRDPKVYLSPKINR